jgi:hypothetical protein
MKAAAPLTIEAKTLTKIKSLARRSKTSRMDETELYYLIKNLPIEEQRDLLALYDLGRPGIRSFNVARKSAANADINHLAGRLTGTPMFLESLKKGLQKFHDQET